MSEGIKTSPSCFYRGPLDGYVVAEVMVGGRRLTQRDLLRQNSFVVRLPVFY